MITMCDMLSEHYGVPIVSCRDATGRIPEPNTSYIVQFHPHFFVIYGPVMKYYPKKIRTYAVVRTDERNTFVVVTVDTPSESIIHGKEVTVDMAHPNFLTDLDHHMQFLQCNSTS